MNPEKVIKTQEYREYTVKQHQRKIFLRKYKFVCGGCDPIHQTLSKVNKNIRIMKKNQRNQYSLFHDDSKHCEIG